MTDNRYFLLEGKYSDRPKLCIVPGHIIDEAKPRRLAHSIMKVMTECDDAIEEVTVTELITSGESLVFKMAEDFPLDVIWGAES